MDDLTPKFSLEIAGASEQHEYALEVIENLIEVSVGDDLNRDVLLEVMAVFSVGYNLAHGDPELIRSLLSHALGRIEAEGEHEFADEYEVIVGYKGERSLH